MGHSTRFVFELRMCRRVSLISSEENKIPESLYICAGSRGPLFWRNEEKLSRFLDAEIRVDKGLTAALAKKSEV